MQSGKFKEIQAPVPVAKCTVNFLEISQHINSVLNRNHITRMHSLLRPEN